MSSSSQTPEASESSSVMKSVVMFFVTMGTVFGGGMLWTTYGDDIAKSWTDDWQGMKDDWKEFTRDKKRRPFSQDLANGLWQQPDFDPQERFNDVSRQLNSNARQRAVVPAGDPGSSSFADVIHDR